MITYFGRWSTVHASRRLRLISEPALPSVDRLAVRIAYPRRRGIAQLRRVHQFIRTVVPPRLSRYSEAAPQAGSTLSFPLDLCR